MLRIALLALALVALAQCQYKAAIFTQTNAVSNIGNEIVLLLHDENDELTIAGRFPTWDFLNNGNRTAGSGPGFVGNPVEPLGSQLAVTVRNNRVYSVNAGSNDWTVAPISSTGDGLGFPTTTNSEGVFPVSIDACGEWVLVANAGAGGTLAGFRLKEDGSYENTFKSDLESNTLTFPPNPLMGVGQVQFIRDCTEAIVTLKDFSSVPAVTPHTSRIFVYRFTDEFEVDQLVKTPFPGDDLIFSFTVDTVDDDEGADDVFMYTTNPVTMSSSSFKINDDLTATLIETVPNGGQAGACWNQNYRNWMFSGNFGSQSISRFNFSDDGQLDLQDATAALGNSPVLDMAGWSNYLYVLFPAEGLIRVYVVNSETGELTAATDGTGLDFISPSAIIPQALNPGPTGSVGLFAVGLQSTDPVSPASFLAPSFLFVLALLKAFF